MARLLAVVLLLLPLLAPLAQPAQAQQGAVDFQVNILSARSLGCSPDSVTNPDLRVTLYLNGEKAHETIKAQDRESPLYADLVRLQATLPATLGVEIHEAEPGGFFGLGTDWVACDAAAGSATRHEFTYRGESALEVTAEGDDARAARARLTLGTDAPALPSGRVSDITATSARVAWDADVSGRTQAHQLARPDAGAVFAQLDAGPGSHELTGLCDNTDYTIRLLRLAPPWHVAAEALAFQTPNVPPPAPRVLEATTMGDGNATVRWQSAGAHDVDRYEVHAGETAAFQPSSSTLRHTARGMPTNGVHAEFVPLQAGDAHVRVLQVDRGGLSNLSGPFALDASPQPAQEIAPPCGLPPALEPANGADATPARPTPPQTTAPTPEAPSQPPEAAGLAPAATSPRDAPLLPDWGVLLLVGLVGLLGGMVVALLMRR